MSTTVTIGKHEYEIGETTALEELRAYNAFRSGWKQSLGLGDSVSPEAERMVAISAMITSIDGSKVTPQVAFETVLNLPKRESDQLKVHYMQLNELENFFEVLAQLQKSVGNDLSSKNTEDSAGEPAKDSQKAS